MLIVDNITSFSVKKKKAMLYMLICDLLLDKHGDELGE